MTGLRIVVDATPLLGQRTGIGHYTAQMLAHLPAALDPRDRLVATAFTARGRHDLADLAHTGLEVATRPIPARLLRALWKVSDGIPVEWLAGRCDLVHGTNFVLPPAKAPGVVMVHDLAYLRYPHTVAPASLDYVQLVPRALARGAVVTTPSRAVADQILDAYAVSPDHVVVTPNGVDPSWSQAAPLGTDDRSRLGLPTAYLLAVGTLEPRKNLALLVDVVRLARARGVDLPPLVIVGAAGWGDALDLTGLEGRVVTTGHVPYRDLQQIVAGAAALLFPSLDEGFGLPPLEALAAGVPVVASDLPVTREVLGDQARFEAPADREAWLEAMMSTLTAPMGTRDSRRAQAEKFTWSASAHATVTAYHRALALWH